MRVLFLKFLFILLALGFSQGLFANSEFKGTVKSVVEKTSFDLNFLLGGGVYQEKPDDSTFVMLSARPQFVTQFNDIFSVRGNIWVNLNTSRTQTRFQSPFFNTFNLMELVASLKPSSYFHFEIGSINQDHLNNRMLIAYRSFPGAILYSGYESKDLTLKAKVQYAIPTSTSFDSDRSAEEVLPTFQTQGIEFSWQALERLHLRADINHFTYTDLPSVVAFESGRLGNQVIGTEPSTSSFRYGFDGISQSYGVDFKYTSWVNQELKIAMIDNFDAPSDRRRSQIVSSTLNFDLENVSIKPTYGLFFAESDSTPALYSAFEYGRNNRDGQVYGLSVDFKEMGFIIHANYFDAQLIESSGVQADMNYGELFMEVNIAEF